MLIKGLNYFPSLLSFYRAHSIVYKAYKVQGIMYRNYRVQSIDYTIMGGDYSQLFPGLLVLDAFYHTKNKNYFQNFQNLFLTPPTGGLNLQKPIIGQKMKIILWGCLIAQMKRFDALITTQKKPQLSARPHFLKNQEKAPKNGHFF